MTISKHDIFATAHRLTREYKQLGGFGNYRDIFAQNLRLAYAQARKAEARKAEAEAEAKAAEADRATLQAAEAKEAGDDAVAQALVKIGCKVWQGKRIYANYHAATIFANYESFGRGRKGQLHEAYYDLTDHTWHNNWIGKLNAKFAA